MRAKHPGNIALQLVEISGIKIGERIFREGAINGLG
jgi:hypothetical protein